MNNGPVQNIRFREGNTLPLMKGADDAQFAANTTKHRAVFDGVDLNEDLFQAHPAWICQAFANLESVFRRQPRKKAFFRGRVCGAALRDVRRFRFHERIVSLFATTEHGFVRRALSGNY